MPPNISSLKDQALELLAQGFRPIPLGAYQETPPAYVIKRCNGDVDKAAMAWPKTPRIKWTEFQERDPTEEEVEAWWDKWPDANIAILTGYEVYVVDADSNEAIEWVENNLTKTPWRVNTKQGRHYYYFAGSKDIGIRNSVGMNAKIDIRGQGGYVVAAGSRHGSGTYYGDDRLPFLHADHYNDLPELAVDDVERIKYYNRTQKEAPKSLASVPGALMDLSLFGNEPIGEPTPDGARNNECARLAGLYFQQGYAISEALDMCIEWNKTNLPPMEEERVALCVHSVSNTHFRNSGQSVPEVPEPAKQVSSLVMSMRDMLQKDEPLPEFFWGDRCIFRGARVILAGAPKIGKSRFALAMAMQAACGGTFMEQKFTRPLKVMWLQAEIHNGFVRERVRMMTAGLTPSELDMAMDNMSVSGRLDLDLKASERDFQELRKTLTIFQPDMLVIDPAINFSSAEENNNAEVQVFFRKINALINEFNCAIILVHHVKKGGPKAVDGGFDDIRGASAFRGWFDTGIKLTGEAEDPVIQWELRNGATPASHMAYFDPEKSLYLRHEVDSSDEVKEERDSGAFFAGQAYSILLGLGSCGIGQFIDLVGEKLSVELPIARNAVAAMLKTTGATNHTDFTTGEAMYVTPEFIHNNPPQQEV